MKIATIYSLSTKCKIEYYTYPKNVRRYNGTALEKIRLYHGLF